MTKAPVPKKPKAKFLSALAETPTIKPANNMTADVIKDMSFKVDAKFHTEFKSTAVAHGLSMKELLEESFDAWKKQKS